MRRLSGAFALAMMIAGLGCAGEVSAKPHATTKYTYYPISGNSAVALYNAMIRRGPHVNGSKAYAATSATSSQRGILAQGKSCQIKNYRFSIDFTIRLPRFANEASLPSETRKGWRAFSDFLRRHEETHRSIWLKCGEDLERKIAAVRAKDCKTADRIAAKLWDQMRISCGRKHALFDAAEQKRLLRHPFVRMVLRGVNRSTQAAATKGRKKKRNFASPG